MAIKKLSPVKKNYSSDYVSVESELARQGFFRSPGAGVTKLPYKEYNGKYRTGLDPEAAYVQAMPKDEREAEITRIKADRKRLEELTGFDLGPTSKYYNFASNLPDDQKVTPVKLESKDYHFDLSNPIQEIAWNWLKVHPTIAPSLYAVENKQVNIQVVQYYVADDEAESTMIFNKKQKLNKAIATLDDINEKPSKLRRIARLMGLPVTEDTKQTTVYNQLDTLLRDGEFRDGKNKGENTITLFTDLVKENEQRSITKDLVAEAIKSSIYRIRQNGKVFEGENEIAASEADLVNFLLDDKNQEDLFALQKRLNINKIADQA